MTFARLRGADWAVLALALALLLTTAFDWYSTKAGEDARNEQDRVSELPPTPEEPSPQQEAAELAEQEETNAWQADAVVDRLILLLVLATVAIAIAAAFLRAAGRSFEPPGTPSGVAAILAVLTAFLVGYRVLQEPDLDSATTIKIGVPLALLALGGLALASARSLRNEEAGQAFREVPDEEPAAPEPTAT